LSAILEKLNGRKKDEGKPSIDNDISESAYLHFATVSVWIRITSTLNNTWIMEEPLPDYS
jgi:hypothetical protein